MQFVASQVDTPAECSHNDCVCQAQRYECMVGQEPTKISPIGAQHANIWNVRSVSDTRGDDYKMNASKGVITVDFIIEADLVSSSTKSDH